MITFKTESGSIYEVDEVDKRWWRIRGEKAAEIRSDYGEFISHSDIKVGQSVRFICPAYNNEEWRGNRIITTTPVEEVTYDLK